MGIHFRGSEKKVEVIIGKRTVKDGEAVAIWNRLGVHKQVIGPKLVRLFFSTINFLDRKTAGLNEYLAVNYKNGNVEHIRGPHTMFQNPVYHTHIEVKKAYSLESASQCVIVNREVNNNRTPTIITKEESEKGGNIMMQNLSRHYERVIINGPNIFFPEVGDNLVHFEWTNTNMNTYTNINDSNEKKNSSSSSAAVSASPSKTTTNKFTILNTSYRSWKIEIPFFVSRQAYGKLQLTFSFGIANVAEMLDNSCGDVVDELQDALLIDISNITSASASVSSTASTPVSIATLQDTNTFSTLSAYVQLLQKANKIGIDMQSVSLRGIVPGEDIIIEQRTVESIRMQAQKETLVIQTENSKAAEELKTKRNRIDQERLLDEAQLKRKSDALSAEHEYIRRKQECEIESKAHALQAEQEYNRKRIQNELSNQQLQINFTIEKQKLLNDETVRMLQSLNSLGLDITKVMTAPSNSSSISSSDGLGMALIAKTPLLSELLASTNAQSNDCSTSSKW